MKSMLKVLTGGTAGLALAAGALLAAGSAQAQTSYWDQGYSYPPTGVTGTAVTGALSDTTLGISFSSVYVGGVDLNLSTTSGGTGTPILVYCIDIGQTLASGGNTPYTSGIFNAAGNTGINEGTAVDSSLNPKPTLTVTAAEQALIANIIRLTPTPTTTTQSAALQAAIWVAEYGVYSGSTFVSSDVTSSSSTTISDGAFTLSSLSSSSVVSLAEQDLTGALSTTTTDTLTDYNGSVDNSQTMVGVNTQVGGNTGKAPEPATLSLLGAGLVALAARHRRNRAK